MSKAFKELFSSVDFLGREVKFTFLGKDRYSTPFSQFLSVFVLIAIGFIYTPIKLIEFAGMTDIKITRTTTRLGEVEYNLIDYGYMFAFEKMDPRIGTMVAQ